MPIKGVLLRCYAACFAGASVRASMDRKYLDVVGSRCAVGGVCGRERVKTENGGATSGMTFGKRNGASEIKKNGVARWGRGREPASGSQWQPEKTERACLLCRTQSI